METVELYNSSMAARIGLLGAELRALSLNGAELLWTPDPALWDGTCLVLFPVIGRVNDDAVSVGGTAYPMPMHGFALTSRFSVVAQCDNRCTLELRAGPETRRSYPYDFALRMTYRLSGSALQIIAEIRNDGRFALPTSLGLHPGFRWPLVPGVPKGRHLLTFDETAPILYTRPVKRLIGRPVRTPAGRRVAEARRGAVRERRAGAAFTEKPQPSLPNRGRQGGNPRRFPGHGRRHPVVAAGRRFSLHRAAARPC
ncbi:hypothetical protein ABK249_29495 [Neorhizobium sp. Rsf11]|uniref:Aldose epimerase n=2 Tax=Neorhizobium TaxID=1525371 RepID=A0ABV0MB77_9HYPH|nr:hypothetical protein [Neorhizobium petrolearium]MCC2613811.1 hypothetical protein [Neorhizobium petrolearium]WGI72120.1 hypothetical protein QEO92_28700 [Neorhizobium petrolearium]